MMKIDGVSLLAGYPLDRISVRLLYTRHNQDQAITEYDLWTGYEKRTFGAGYDRTGAAAP